MLRGSRPDRGCAVSQYPHEAECLFAPLTGKRAPAATITCARIDARRNGPAVAGLEMLDTRIEGTVLVIVARLSVNLNALTIEQAPAPLCPAN